jgi:Concanavalin A-like lectin/glucanases superfamily
VHAFRSKFTMARHASVLAIMLVSCNVYDSSTEDTTVPEASAPRDAARDVRGDGSSCAPRDSCTGGAGGSGTGGGAGGGAGRAGSGGTADVGDGTGGMAGASDAAGGMAGANDGSGGTAGAAADGGRGDGISGAAGDASVDIDVVVEVGAPCPIDARDGSCGDAAQDVARDTDSGVVDTCPNDPMKTEPGICGCGAADPSDPDAGPAFCLRALLVHRYSFNGTGTAATDSIGTAHGTIVGGTNATLSGGSVALSGDLGARYTSEGYVQLPPGLLDPLTSATLEAWVTWRGMGGAGGLLWQRIFDFGSQVTSGSELVGSTYLFLTPQATSGGPVRVAYSIDGSQNETRINGTGTFPLNVQTHVAVVIDDPSDTMTLYMNGAQIGSVALTGTLAAIDHANSWLGRSNYGVDPEFNGLVHEFRVYRVALTPAQVQTSHMAGPDTAF